MADSHTVVTKEGYFSRIANSIKGIFVGIILIVVAIAVLWWNEGRTVHRTKDLNFGQKQTVSISSDSVDPSNEGKLVHTTGKAMTGETLRDDVFGLPCVALRLRRNVEMYQWAEESHTKEEKKTGGSVVKTTTYTYKQIWSSSVIDSSGFHESADHQNPGSMLFNAQEWQVDTAALGAFTLNSDQISRISNFAPITLTAETISIPQSIKSCSALNGNMLYVSVNTLENGQMPGTPSIGDLRITFEKVDNQDISLIYAQTGNGFAPFHAKYGNIAELKIGTHTVDEMYAAAHSSNKLMAWLLRLGGLIVMFIGFSTILKPISVLADVLPFLGNIVETGIGLISFLLALGVSLVIICLAWIFYRPLLGIALLILAIAVIVLIVKKIFLKKPKAA